MVIGALVLIGWIYNIPTLKSVLPNLAAMKANAAVCFILSGLALVLLKADRPARPSRLAARACALFVALLAAVTLGEHLFGWDLGLDELFFTDPIRTVGKLVAPGRMVPVVTFNFVLLGGALLLLSGRSRTGTKIAQALALIVLFDSLLALCSYILNVEALYHFPLYSVVALHGAITFSVLSLGVLAARPDQGLMAQISADDAGGVVARRLLPAALLIPILLAWLSMFGLEREFYDDNIAASIRITAFMAVFAVIVWMCARFLSQSDAVRRQAEETLRRTAAELARSNAELEQFAYVSSHDLQEPLRAVAGCVQLLQRRYQEKLDERADELIRHAVEGATRMQNLINDLLAYSRVGTRGRPFELVACEAVLREVRASLEVAILESGAEISSDELPTVLADRVQLGQLLQNLIGNAIKFRGDAAPRIQLGARREGEAWLFRVSDNGIGIEPQYFERIFSVFQRLHSVREYPGTGIGLAICKKIIERHGGRIWLESELGRGTTFCFTLADGRGGETGN